MNIVMVGSGYVGLVSGACFAELGFFVTCVDSNKEKVKNLKNLIMPIYEPGLEELVSKNVSSGNLKFSYNLQKSIENADIVFIAVGTPSRAGDGHADLKYVHQVSREISKNITKYILIVNKSTAPVGTVKQISRIIKENNREANFDVASNPEFLREGSAIDDFMNPDRIILGVESERAKKLLDKLYKPMANKNVPLIHTNHESAEIIKYASNAFLATKISFINEISNLCEKVGADVADVSKGMGLDPRIGEQFLRPGPGYGGSCFPKDTNALVKISQEHGVSSRVVQAVIEANSAQKSLMVSKIRSAMKGFTDKKNITFLGLTFKPETDDMRDAASLSIIPSLIENGANIKAHDPQGLEEAKLCLPNSVEFHDDIYKAVSDSDAIVLLTEWKEYYDLDMKKILSLMNGNHLFDFRNIFNQKQMIDYGFEYSRLGRQ